MSGINNLASILLFTFFVFTKLGAQMIYQERCIIEDDRAIGYVDNLDEAFEIDGDLVFFFYDSLDNFISYKKEYEYEFISSRDTEEIDDVSIPTNATTCSFSIKEAIKGSNNLKTLAKPTKEDIIQINYRTRCSVKDNKAIGFVDNYSDAFEIDGDLLFLLYDSKNKMIEVEKEYEYEYVSSKDSEEIDDIRVTDEVATCILKINDAIKDKEKMNINAVESGSTAKVQKHNYNTRCEIKEGKAYGYVDNPNDSFIIDGTLIFVFYDCYDNVIKIETEYEYEYVSSNSSEEIDYIMAPQESCKCEFRIEKAIK